MILTIRTEKPEAEIGLYTQDGEQLVHESWQAHRQLAETLHQKITDLLALQQATMTDISGIVAFAGPGSFTGLRIGISVANALAYSNDCGVVATNGDAWIDQGVERLKNGVEQKVAVPLYDTPANTTAPRK